MFSSPYFGEAAEAASIRCAAANRRKGIRMIKRLALLALLATAVGVSAQNASADQTNAPNSTVVTAICNGTQYQVVTNGNGTFTPAHVIGTSMEFIPTALDLRFSFTDTSGNTMTDTETSSKPHAPTGVSIITCDIPAGLNTFTSPGGTFVLSGTVTGFFAH